MGVFLGETGSDGPGKSRREVNVLLPGGHLWGCRETFLGRGCALFGICASLYWFGSTCFFLPHYRTPANMAALRPPRSLQRTRVYMYLAWGRGLGVCNAPVVL